MWDDLESLRAFFWMNIEKNLLIGIGNSSSIHFSLDLEYFFRASFNFFFLLFFQTLALSQGFCRVSNRELKDWMN